MKEISKYASMMYRCGQIYYNEKLKSYHIGCGQQFFLLHIYEKPGISQYELAQMGNFDKGTTARAIKKLMELGYVERCSDEEDRRMVRLYVSKKGEPLIPIIHNMLEDWYEALVTGFTKEEQKMVSSLMKRLGENAKKEVRSR